MDLFPHPFQNDVHGAIYHFESLFFLVRRDFSLRTSFGNVHFSLPLLPMHVPMGMVACCYLTSLTSDTWRCIIASLQTSLIQLNE